MKIHALKLATDWVAEQLVQTSAGYWTLKDEACSKFGCDPEDFEEIFKLRFCYLMPLQEVGGE